MSILLPNNTVADRDLQFRESSIVVDDETDAAFVRPAAATPVPFPRVAGSSHFAP
jgi:hypothetical protein